MIRSLHLMNFKSFEAETIEFSPLTLLMGENGAGKSSVIQSLLLLRQSSETGALGRGELNLNGSYCSVGTGSDLLRQGSDDEVIGILVDTQDVGHGFTFAYDADADTLALDAPAILPDCLAAPGFTYLTAERIGPRLTNPRSIARAAERQMGIHGEGALAVLEQFRATILSADDPRRRGRTGSLEELFQGYLAEICSGARIELQPYSNVDSIGSTYSFSAPGGLPGSPFRPTNVGFGLSYGLPVIVACLVAEPGSMLIIENPEAHLHTRSQRAVCELITATALAGVQVVVETHSRELFHWLRNQAVRGMLPAETGRINYIEAGAGAGGQRSSSNTTLYPLNAALSGWPQNFFDAYGSPLDLVAPI